MHRSVVLLVFYLCVCSDPSLLTLLATIGLFLTLADFIGPKVWLPLHKSVINIINIIKECLPKYSLSDLGQGFQARVLDK